jgi:hypothetical protein
MEESNTSLSCLKLDDFTLLDALPAITIQVTLEYDGEEVSGSSENETPEQGGSFGQRPASRQRKKKGPDVDVTRPGPEEFVNPSLGHVLPFVKLAKSFFFEFPTNW